MFNIGWAECLVIVAVAVLVIGPKDLPKLLYSAGRLARRIQYMKFAMTRQMDEVMNQIDLDDLRKHGVTLPDTDESAFDDDMADEKKAAGTHGPD
jgi:sec-independent protein translocase protein TatB